MQQLPDHPPALSVLSPLSGTSAGCGEAAGGSGPGLLLLTSYRVASPAIYDVQLQMGHLAAGASFLRWAYIGDQNFRAMGLNAGDLETR